MTLSSKLKRILEVALASKSAAEELTSAIETPPTPEPAQSFSPSNTVEMYEEFFVGNNTFGAYDWAPDSSGSAAINAAAGPGPLSKYVGTLRLEANTGGKCNVGNTHELQFMLGAGQSHIAEFMVHVDAVPTALEDYIFAIGFTDTPYPYEYNLAALLFVIDRNTSGDFWQIETYNSSTTESHATTVPLTVGWHKLRMEVNADGTEAKFYINDVLAYTKTTNLPVDPLQLGIAMGVTKAAGSVSSSVHVDYVYLKIDLSEDPR